MFCFETISARSIGIPTLRQADSHNGGAPLNFLRMDDPLSRSS